jgi:hypothetical protein
MSKGRALLINEVMDGPPEKGEDEMLDALEEMLDALNVLTWDGESISAHKFKTKEKKNDEKTR